MVPGRIEEVRNGTEAPHLEAFRSFVTIDRSLSLRNLCLNPGRGEGSIVTKRRHERHDSYGRTQEQYKKSQGLPCACRPSPLLAPASHSPATAACLNTLATHAGAAPRPPAIARAASRSRAPRVCLCAPCVPLRLWSSLGSWESRVRTMRTCLLPRCALCSWLCSVCRPGSMPMSHHISTPRSETCICADGFAHTHTSLLLTSFFGWARDLSVCR